MFDKFGKLLPLLSLAIVLFGIFNLDNLYANYGIEIFNYVEVSEILLSFTDLFQALIYLFGYFVIFIVLFIIVVLIPKKKYFDLNNYDAKWLLVGVLILFFLVNWGGIYALYIFFGNRPDQSALRFDYCSLALIIFNFLCLYGIQLLYKRVMRKSAVTVEKYDSFIYQLIPLTFLLLVYFEIRNNLTHKFHLEGCHKYEMSLMMDDSSQINSNDSIIYIGSTKNFIFFKNIKSERNIIIPSSEVKMVTTKKLREGL